jgi:uncharacterized protein YutE (UPF0331/DUF86 family)
MKDLKVKRETILDRMGIIENSLKKLEDMKSLPSEEFLKGENFAIAEHYLRYALEATFDICAHILSRIPGAIVDEYKKMATEMGKQNIIPMDFAEENLYQMAGYRNRLTHFYFEISPKEMYEIIQNKLGDFKALLKYFKKVIEK